MPVYEYQCEKCENIYEEQRKISEYKHPFYCACDGNKNECKLIINSALSIRKGAGLYSVDRGKVSVLKGDD